MSLVICLICCFVLVNGNDFDKKYDEEEGRAYLQKINSDIQVKTTESVLASWAYESNITDSNLQHQLEVSAKLANYTKEIWKETIKYPWKTFRDPDVRRQFQKFSVLGTAILSPSKYERYNKIISDMQSVYGKAKICSYSNRSDCSLQLEPELTEIFVKSRNPDELRYYWEQWRNAAGKPVREMYKEYVELSNEAAVLNNFTNNAEFWLKDYEASDFKEQVEALWQQLQPLYLQLHAFVRRRLREQYGEEHVTKRGPIPAHLLGNMWAQSWGNVFDFTVPYPGKPSLDVTPNMVEQGYTPLRMFKLAEEFFTSLNLSPMPESFWKNSILEKPKDGRDLICHASAWDFYDGKDFRIKQCTRITMEDLNTVHHEMGHIQYFLQYKNQPLVYKEGSNPGFHEAVGDVMALSVSTPKHLRKIGLLNSTEDDAESEINQLYNMALEKIAFLPFGYLMDQWRWSVFEGKTTEKEYNCKWWQLREKYQGLSPSVVRTEEDFDPGAKYHTVGNVPYIRYFVSFVIQFQFHRSLCIAAKEFDPQNPSSKPLHKCDIYQSKEAGALLQKMLQMGSSKPWPDAMEVITGQRNMDASALLEYFATLQDWLEKENARTGEFIGWESSQKECIVEEGIVKSSDSQGNFEDDNIAYSYAEFVRQDDNAFGFPDFLEETQPSYQALRHRSKENGGNYLLVKRNNRRFSNNPYQPEGSHLLRSRKEFVRSVQSKFPRDLSQYGLLRYSVNPGNFGNINDFGKMTSLGYRSNLKPWNMGNPKIPGSLSIMGHLGNGGHLARNMKNKGNLGSCVTMENKGILDTTGNTENLQNMGNIYNYRNTLSRADSDSSGNANNMQNLGNMYNFENMVNRGNMGNINNLLNRVNMGNMGNVLNRGNMGNMGNTDNTGNTDFMDYLKNLGNLGNLGNLLNVGNMGNTGNQDNTANEGIAVSMGNTVNTGNTKNQDNSVNAGNTVSKGNMGSMVYLGSMGNSRNTRRTDKLELRGKDGGSESLVYDDLMNPQNSVIELPLENFRDEKSKDLKLVDGILKNIQYLHNIKPQSEFETGFPKPVSNMISRRNTDFEMQALPNYDYIKKALGEEENQIQVKDESKGRTYSLAEDNHKDLTCLTENNRNSEELSDNKSRKQKNIMKLAEGSGGDSFGDLTLLSKAPKVFRSSNEMLWKAELIKKETENMLKSLNIVPKGFPGDKLLDNYYPHIVGAAEITKSQKKSRNILPLYHTSEYIRPGKNTNSMEFIKKTCIRSLRNNAQSQKPLRYRDDLMEVVPADTQLAPREKKRHVRTTRGADSEYLVMVENLPSKVTRQKKSYKEYHFKPKVSIPYNAVILTDQKPQSGTQSLAKPKNLRGFDEYMKYIRSSVLHEKPDEQTFTKNSFIVPLRDKVK